MRLVIIGFDGLEARLVEKYRLLNIMQEYHGIYNAAISPRYGKPHTPSAWTTIITGKSPEEHGVDDWWTYGRLIDTIRTKPPLSWFKGKRIMLAKIEKILNKLGLRVRLLPSPRIVDRRNIKVPTLFDEYPSLVVFWPAWNEPIEPHIRLAEALKKSIRDYIEEIWRLHHYRRRLALDKLREFLDNRELQVYASWFDLADLIGHVCIVKCRIELVKAYIELDRLAARIHRLIEESGQKIAILILSDHGMELQPDGTGDHSRYGFWSINIKPSFTPHNATDFYPLFKNILAL